MKLAGARGITRSRVPLIALMALAVIGIAGCEGDDGATGPQGPAGSNGTNGTTGPTGPTGPAADVIAATKVENCQFCHGGEVARSGQSHQDIYNKYTDASNLALEFVSVDSAGAAAPYTVTLTFKITQNGAPFVDVAGLPKLAGKTFYAATYDSATRTFAGSTGFTVSATTTVPTANPGEYTLTKTDFAYAPEHTNAVVYGQVAQTPLNIEDSQYNPDAGKRITMYDNRASDSLSFGDAGTYVSAANVESCEACHGKPYMKHGNITAVNDGSPNFVSCRTCHYDNRQGGHLDWQWMVDDPAEWAAGTEPTDYATRYAYKAKLMNDVHMSHAMEFPYPQSMANCATCHAGKLTQVLADKQFEPETCKSCHPVKAQDKDEDGNYKYWDAKRAPALEDMWADEGVSNIHTPTADCGVCHSSAANAVAPSFAEYHTGYDKAIYDATGKRYSDLYSVKIDSVTKTGNVVNVKFSATNTATVPELIVSFYGYDTKDMLVSSHTRGSAPLCPSSTNANQGCRMEYVVGTNLDTVTTNDNALFVETKTTTAGTWDVSLDLAKYVPLSTTGLPSIPTLITQGKVKRMEISILPALTIGEEEIAINGAAQSYTVTATSATALSNWFKGTNAIAQTAKCNKCHDMLGTTFHTGEGYGSVGVEGCRNCHVPTSSGGALEMESRSIDGFVHAIHAFQQLEISDVDFTDAVETKRYWLHVEHTWPLFTANACEGCHAAGKFAFANNATALPGLHSAVSKTWTNEDGTSRKVGPENQFVTGPGSRACGGCHRAYAINEDNAAELATFSAHLADEGYIIDNTTTNPSTTTWVYRVIEKIMASVN